MQEIRIFPLGDSPALPFAAKQLRRWGFTVVNSGETATHVLMNVPNKEDFSMLPSAATVIGSKLDAVPDTYRKIDLLRDDWYLTENAALTADCALRLLGQHLRVAFRGCPVLVIGWGRIGKCLSALLKGVGCTVTVAARKSADREMLRILGYDATDISQIQPQSYRAIVNTAPAPVLGDFEGECVKIDLASVLGMAGADVLWARGLPGKMLPEAAGKLLAQGVLRHLQEG